MSNADKEHSLWKRLKNKAKANGIDVAKGVNWLAEKDQDFYTLGGVVGQALGNQSKTDHLNRGGRLVERFATCTGIAAGAVKGAAIGGPHGLVVGAGIAATAKLYGVIKGAVVHHAVDIQNKQLNPDTIRLNEDNAPPSPLEKMRTGAQQAKDYLRRVFK